MRTVLLCIYVCLLCSCGMIPQLPTTVPNQPLYVVAGRDGIEGYGHTHVTLVDGATFKVAGNRSVETTYIESGVYVDQAIWLGFAGNNNTDKFIVSKITNDLSFQTDYIPCMEPRSIHVYGDTLIVLCQDRGFVTVAMVISRRDGHVTTGIVCVVVVFPVRLCPCGQIGLINGDDRCLCFGDKWPRVVDGVEIAIMDDPVLR